jgi:hypothetical protein
MTQTEYQAHLENELDRLAEQRLALLASIIELARELVRAIPLALVESTSTS